MIRIEWTIDGRTGHGDWMPNTPQNHAALSAHVQAMNAKHGANTHRIASR